MKKVFNCLDQYLEMVLMYIVAFVLIFSVILQIVSRTVMMPFSWTEELARFAFIWLTFFGIGYGVRHATHTRIEVLDRFMPDAVKAFMPIIYTLLGLAAWGIVLYASRQFVEFTALNRAPALNTTILVRNLAVVFGAVITLIRLVQRLVLDVLHFVNTLKKGEAK